MSCIVEGGAAYPDCACSPESSKSWAKSSARKTSPMPPGSSIRGPVVTADAGHGDSIAVNGVCLTVVEVQADGQFTADVMDETLDRSSLRGVGVGSRVNLERGRGAQQPARRSHRAGPRRRHRACDCAHTVGALGGGADRAADRALALCRREGLDHRRRRLADRFAPRARLVRGVADPDHAGDDHPGPGERRRRRQPRGRRHRQVRRTADGARRQEDGVSHDCAPGGHTSRPSASSPQGKCAK